MIVREITLEGFRSYGKSRFTLGPQVNIICGLNGRGKTNLLEGIFLLSGMRSWRTNLRRELIGWDSPLARITATVISHGRDYEIVLTLPRQGVMTATINGVKVSRQNPLSDIFRGVLFSPEDLMLVKGPPSQRRDFMDAALGQLRPNYMALVNRYQRVLSSKSRMLKQGRERGADPETLPEYNEQLAALGARIIRYRAAFVQGLAREAGAIQRDISGGSEHLSLRYKTVSTVEDTQAAESQLSQWLSQHLSGLEEAERAAGICLSGVHRDDLVLSLSDHGARAFASQGQARSAALALRFAQRALFLEDLDEPPVVMLDDVLSELDEQRRAYVCRGVGGGQCILTCCQPEESFREAHIITL